MHLIQYLVLFLTSFTDFPFVKCMLEMGTCKQDVCVMTNECHLMEPRDNHLFFQYCTKNDKRFIECEECRINEDIFTLDVQVNGIKDHMSLLDFSAILIDSVKACSSTLQCGVLYFASWSDDMATDFNFFHHEGEWITNTPTLITSNIKTRIYLFKVYHGDIIGALDPVDMARLLKRTEVEGLLNKIGITVKICENLHRRDSDINSMDPGNNGNGGEDEEDNKRLGSQALILILFGVVMFTIFLSLTLVKTKPRWIGKFRRVHRSSRSQVVIENVSSTYTTTTEPTAQPSGIISEVFVDGLHPPPYTIHDEYKQNNPPPPYSTTT